MQKIIRCLGQAYLAAFAFAPPSMAIEPQCPKGSAPNPNVVWCEDFETTALFSTPAVEIYSKDSDFKVDSKGGFGGSSGMRATWQKGVQHAGKISVFLDKLGASSAPYDEIFWRFYVRHDNPVAGNTFKLTRATILANDQWAQAMIAHLWADGDRLCLDPATGIANDNSLATTKYNDFEKLQWLGKITGKTPLFTAEQSGKWHCVEAHVRLNTPDEKDGIFQFWIDNNLEAEHTKLNWRGTWNKKSLNLILFENYWNDGAPVKMSRTWDNIVISRSRIGCKG